MRHQLIIIDGQSTVGKSSISKSVFEKIALYEEAYWLHEECKNHPIRENEFEAGDIHTLQGMEINLSDMLHKWESFRNEIIKNKQICITEGCFFHTIDRYLLESIWSEKEIYAYFQQIINILQPLNPLIVFLHRPNIRKSFEKAFISRGNWWKDLILSVPEPYGYFETNKYMGDESIFQALSFEQAQMKNVYNQLTCTKMIMDTSDECWGKYVQEIIEKCGYIYSEDEDTSVESERYCGTYQIEGGEDIWIIKYNTANKQFYTSLFWPFMPMKYIGNETFELISFPVIIRFKTNHNVLQFVVEGNYDWEYNGRRFLKQ